MIKSIQRIGMSALAAGLGLLVTPVARAQDSVFVTTTGDVGIGTSTPSVRLDVKANAAGQAAARLQSSSATGHSGIHYLDSAGNIDLYFGLDNAASTTRLDSVNNNPILLLTNSVERMRITSAGKVGIGTATPVSKLDIVADIADESARVSNINAAGYPGFSYFDETGAIGLFFGLDNANNTTRLNSVNNNPIVILTNSAERIRFPSPGGNFITAANGASLSAGGIWVDASSRDFKKDIVNLDTTEALAAIKKLDPVKFQYKSEPGEQYLGFIAEDVPELVARNDHKSLSPMDIVAVLTKVVQEQQKTIDELTAKVTELQQKVQ